MAIGPFNNPYEEERRRRLEENKRRFQELGVGRIAQSLNEKVIKIKNKPLVKDQVKSKKAVVSPGQLRRSSRPHNVTSYAEEFVTQSPRRKWIRSSSSTRYKAKRVATKKERSYPLKCAKRFQSRLSSGHPSCVKSLHFSHVSSYMLSVPRQFGNDHFPGEKLAIVLEDEQGSTYDTNYLGESKALSGGWKSFAADHELNDGDALVLELIEPRRLKVYIFRVPNGRGVKGTKVYEAKKVRDYDTDDDTDEDYMANVGAEEITRPMTRSTGRKL